MKITIKERASWGGAVLFEGEFGSTKLALEEAVSKGASLVGVGLTGVGLTGAYLREANLREADLRGADLTRANLTGADLTDGYLLKDENDEPIKHAGPDESVANLDKVREIVLDDEARLDMSLWHANEGWTKRSCAEEAICGTAHCLAGWLQVCSTDKTLRSIDPQLAGIYAAPVAAKMFSRNGQETLAWLKDRKYVEEAKDYAEPASA